MQKRKRVAAPNAPSKARKQEEVDMMAAWNKQGPSTWLDAAKQKWRAPRDRVGSTV